MACSVPSSDTLSCVMTTFQIQLIRGLRTGQQLAVRTDCIRIWQEAVAVDWQAVLLSQLSSREAEENRETSKVRNSAQ